MYVSYYIMFRLFLISSILTVAICYVPNHESTSTQPPPPRPYAFGYAAGRYPGHIDRTHSEISDGSGVVQGSYSYVDPKYQIRTVEYVADQNGFHPVLNFSPPPLPSDSAAVAEAKQRHLNQYNAIANAHQAGGPLVPGQTASVQKATAKHYDLYQKIAAEHARLAAEREAENLAREPESYEPNHLDQY